jgi:hypothetical protein
LVELVEYTFVVLAGLLFAGASVAVYGQFSEARSGLAASAALDEVAGLAREAEANGTASYSIVVPPTTIACSDRTLSANSSGVSLSEGLDSPCGFSLQLTGGAHTFTFSEESGTLTLSVK